MQVIVQADAAAAAALTASRIAQALRSNPRLVLGLATGRTMEPLYRALVEMHEQEGLDFSACRAFNLDEYVGLPAGDPHSFRLYMEQHLFSKVNMRRGNIHIPDGSAADLDAESANYEQLIAQCGGIDLQLLGIGLNGHIGFNEPPADLRSRTHVQLLSRETLDQNAPHFSARDEMPRRAVTMGIGTILESRRCLALATGVEKANIAARAVEGAVLNTVPASVLQLHPNFTLILDAAAASALGKTQPIASVIL